MVEQPTLQVFVHRVDLVLGNQVDKQVEFVVGLGLSPEQFAGPDAVVEGLLLLPDEKQVGPEDFLLLAVGQHAHPEALADWVLVEHLAGAHLLRLVLLGLGHGVLLGVQALALGQHLLRRHRLLKGVEFSQRPVFEEALHLLGQFEEVFLGVVHFSEHLD